MFVHLSDEVDLRDEAFGSPLKSFGLLVTGVAFVRVVKVSKPLVNLFQVVELELVPELPTEDTVGAFHRSLVPGAYMEP